MHPFWGWIIGVVVAAIAITLWEHYHQPRVYDWKKRGDFKNGN
jgi:predicted PurR-regulated permease PerM